jgi:hypothetical protein
VGKISNEAKQKYISKITEYRTNIETLLKKEQESLRAFQSAPENGPAIKLALADDILNLVSYYLLLNSLSLNLLGVKNDGYLNNARKGCYKSIIYLEDVVSPFLDVPFSEYEEKLEKIKDFTHEQRFKLLRKLGFSIQAVVDAFGENSKWRWSFVELNGRFSVVTKNFLDLKNLLSNLDPRSEGYEAIYAHLELTKSLMQAAADDYRQKYELSTLRIDDFRMGVNFLTGLRRIHILLGNAQQTDELKKKAEIWKTKMEADTKRIEKQVKKPAK